MGINSVIRSRTSDGEISDRSMLALPPSYLRASPDGAWLLAVQSGPAVICLMNLR